MKNIDNVIRHFVKKFNDVKILNIETRYDRVDTNEDYEFNSRYIFKLTPVFVTVDNLERIDFCKMSTMRYFMEKCSKKGFSASFVEEGDIY